MVKQCALTRLGKFFLKIRNARGRHTESDIISCRGVHRSDVLRDMYVVPTLKDALGV